MPAEIANTTLASAPYYDDFDESKKFHRVLFRPSIPVQARELTQLQSILQNQIERFGDGVFKTGSIIKGCAPTIIPEANYVVVPDSFDVTNTDFENAILYGVTSGVQARILKGQAGNSTTTSPSKLFIKYTSVGKNGATTFVEGETLKVYGEDQSFVGSSVIRVSNANNFVVDTRVRGKTTNARGTIVSANTTSDELVVTNVRKQFVNGEILESLSNTSLSTTVVGTAINFTNELGTASVLASSNNYTATGNAYALAVSEGVVYQKGFFVKTDAQTIILNDSEGGPAAANGILVGIETQETIVDEFADETLYDNSAGISNDAAPGAHRLKLDTTFVKYTKGSEPEDEVFFAIAEFGTSNILKWNNVALSGAVGDELAQRTYDESGHYTVKDFTVSTKPSANNEQFEYVIGDGKAYVRGNAIKFDSVQTLAGRRGTDTESPVQQIVSMNYGSYVNVQEVRGYFPADESAEVALYNTFQGAVSNGYTADSSATGTQIGTANIRNIVFDEDGDAKGSPTARYKFYLFNVKMEENENFGDVRSIVYANTANAFSDIAVSETFNVVSSVAINQAGGGYVTGDTIVIPGGAGESATLSITANGTGNVTALAILSEGRYTIDPSTSNVAISGGNGSGLTVDLTLSGEVESQLLETSYNSLAFGLSNRAVKSLKNANNDSDTRFYYNLAVDSTMDNTGTIILSIPDGGSFAGFSDSADASEKKIDLVFSNTAISANLAGTVNASSSAIITGSGTAFTTDFVVGEKIRFNGSATRRIVSIANNTSLTVDSSISVNANTYTRYHDKGSVVSLATSSRTISVDPSLQIVTIEMGSNYAAATTPVKARLYTRKVNARPIGKTVKRNQLVRFYNGALTGTISSSGTTVTGTGGTTFSTDFKPGNYLRADGQTRKIISAASASSLVVESAFATNLSANTYEIVHPYGLNLGVPDVFNINRIAKTNSATDDNNTSLDISRFFTVDFGQRDTHYDHAVLYPKSTLDLANTYLIVDYDCFEANASIGKGFFSVESYNVDDSANANTLSSIKTWEIPSFYSPSRQKTFDLRDTIDFRPYKSNTAVLTSNAQATTINPPPTSSFNSATTTYNPFPGQNFECNLTYYVPRRDALVLTSKGEFKVVEGEASLQPRTPYAESDTQMVIANIYVPAYPSLTQAEAQRVKLEPYTMKVSPTVNKRFTMKDISAIEQRVSSLEYYTTLTRLEQKATQLNIPDENGVDRFKNGIFVDPFDNHNLARLNNSEHKIVIDNVQGVGRPMFSVETVKVQLNGQYGDSKAVVRDSANNIAYNKDFITVDYDANTVFLEQEFATREIPVDSDDRFLFGTIDLDKETFADVEQFRNYPTRQPGTPYDSYETSANYTVELLYPATRTIKILVRGLKPNARHFVGVDNTDYSLKAVPGYISAGLGELPENIVSDGAEGEELYADSNGRLYAILNLPGNITIGTHVVTASDVVVSAVNTETCSSKAHGSFTVESVDALPDYPGTATPPPTAKTPLLVADFDVIGALTVEEGTDHVLTFVNKTNRGAVAPEGESLIEPTSFSWEFVNCSTGCASVDVETSTSENPAPVTYTFPTMIETVYVKLVVSGGGVTSEVVKPVQLTKYQDNGNLSLVIYNQIKGDNNNYYMSSGGIAKAVNRLHLIFRASMKANRVSGGKCKIEITGIAGTGGSQSGTNFTATDIGVASITNNDAKPDGGRNVGLLWNAPITDNTLTIRATYVSATGVELESVEKTISFTNTGTLTPCKPCGARAEITPVTGTDGSVKSEARVVGDVVEYVAQQEIISTQMGKGLQSMNQVV